MKKNLVMKLAGIACGLICGWQAVAGESSLAQKIKGQLIFTTPITWQGNSEPPAVESEQLQTALAAFQKDFKSGCNALAAFVAANPDSAWTPSIRQHLVQEYGRIGEIDAVGQQQAELKKMERKDSAAPYRLTAPTKRVTKHEHSLSCGTVSLSKIINIVRPGHAAAHDVTHVTSPANGFSLLELKNIVAANGLIALPVRRKKGELVQVPAVAHFREGHYVAVTEKSGGKVRVYDPKYATARWITEAEFEKQASGSFLLMATNPPAGWEKLTDKEADVIRGEICNNPGDDIDDSEDDGDQDDGPPCPPPPPPTAGDGPGAEGGEDCPPEDSEGNAEDPGMPVWRVSEPYISLWLHDTPLFYRQSNGRNFRLRLSYNQRAEDKGTAIPGFGTKWECDWFGFVQQNTNDVVAHIDNFHAGGGKTVFTTDGPSFPTSGSRNGRTGRRLSVTGYESGGSTVGMAKTISIENKQGRINQYGFKLPYANGTLRYVLTNRADAYGRNTRFGYSSNYIGGNVVYRLTTMTDMDGKQCTLDYTNTLYPNLVTSVTDPYTRTARFIYDHLGRLTNITDMIGMASSFKYDSDGVITNMVTLYGTNSFRYLSVSNGVGDWCRAIEVTEPENKQQLYMFRSQSSSGMVGSGLPAFYPTLRNSYHWNRAQFGLLDAIAKTNYFEMDATNYLIASIKNWYAQDQGLVTYVGGALNAQAGPAVDGYTRINGVKYYYQGQSENTFARGFYGVDTENTPYFPVLIETVSGDKIELPRNEWGRPTNIIKHRYDPNIGYYTAGYTNLFNAEGRILQKVWGPSGELLRRYGYDSVQTNLLTSMTNVLGEVLSYTHDSAVRVTSISRPSGLLTTNTYNSSGDFAGFLAKTVDVGFRTNSYSYVNGNIFIHTNELGLVTSNLWDKLNRVVCTYYPDGTTTSNIYERLDLVAKKDRLNNWTYFGYNRLRQLVAVTNANGQFTIYDYCNCGSPSEIKRWDGGAYLTTTFNYDIAGRQTSVNHPDGYYQNFRYDNAWPRGNSTLNVQDSSGLVVHLSRSDFGQLADVGLSQDINGSPAKYLNRSYFDAYGRVSKTIDWNGVIKTNAYDLLGRLTNRATLDIDGYFSSAVSYAYTSRGLTNSVDELGHNTRFVYDAAGRLQAKTNANNEVLQFTYNAADQMLTLKDGKNQQTSWNYDVYGRVTNKLDAVREIFRYKYDPLNRLTNRWTAQKGDTFYKYDPIGNLTNVDYPGTIMDITMHYDRLNRLTNVVDAIGTTRFGYNNASLLTSEDGPWAEDAVTYSYDARRRTGLSLSQLNASAWTQSYGYDEYNRLANTASSAGTFIYSYWTGNSSFASDRVEYLGLGGLNYYNEIGYIANSYDSLARLTNTALLYGSGAALRNQHGYVLNEASQRTRQTFSDGNTAGNTHFTDYTYDDIGQLRTALGKDRAYDYGLSDFVESARKHEQFGYTYDQAWNLNYRTNNSLVQTFKVNTLNELTNVTRVGTFTVAGQATGPRGGDQSWSTPNGVTNVVVSGTGLTTGNAELYADGSWAKTNATLADGNNTYTATAKDTYDRAASDSLSVNLPAAVNLQYDLNGNLTNDSQRVFEYDYENQLTNVYVASAWKSEFKYDAFGRKRVQKEYGWTGSAWSLTNEVRYVYDGILAIQERNANNVALVSYTRGNDISGRRQGAGGIGGLLARTESAQLLSPDTQNAQAYYHSDGNGNVTCLINAGGIILTRYSYDSYGNLLGMSGPLAVANAYRFNSKEWNNIGGLYYYGYRFYDPNLQRWINRDPIKERGGVNLYCISLNDAVNKLDLLGLDSCHFAGPFLVVKPSWFKFWRPSEEVYWGTPEMYKEIVGDVALQNAIEQAAAAAAVAAAAAAVVDSHDKTPVPERDETGKVHGDLPKFVPADWTKEQLDDAADELRESLKRRQQEQEQLGEDGPHRKRIAEEEDLLRQIEKKCE